MAEKLVKVALEVGQRKTFASAIEWPGWSRGAKDKEAAMQSLLEYSGRYQDALARTSISFDPPTAISEFHVVEESKGNATTDFGAPDLTIDQDHDVVSSEEHAFFEMVFKACWQTFDEAVERAQGKQLRKGPRGGGRDLEAMIDHMIGADESYLYRIGWKTGDLEELSQQEKMNSLRDEILAGLAAKVAGELPDEGPRGGKRWLARFFVRRVAWHALDHAWEIEDRIQV